MPRPQNFVSAFVNIYVCPPPFFGKMFTKLTDKNRVGPPPHQTGIGILTSLLMALIDLIDEIPYLVVKQYETQLVDFK